MSTVTVIYRGGAPAVDGPNGLRFERGKRVNVDADLAPTLGPDFEIQNTTRKADAE